MGDERGLIQPADELATVVAEEHGEERGPVGALGVGLLVEPELVLEQDARRGVGVLAEPADQAVHLGPEAGHQGRAGSSVARRWRRRIEAIAATAPPRTTSHPDAANTAPLRRPPIARSRARVGADECAAGGDRQEEVERDPEAERLERPA